MNQSLFSLFLSFFMVTTAWAGRDIHFPYHLVTQPDSRLGFANKPNSLGFSDTTGERVTYRINSDGFRDREFSKKSGAHKLLAVGASWLYGLGINIEARWTQQLEEKFCDLSTYNLSVQGYTFDQIYLMLDQFLKGRGLQKKEEFEYLVVMVPPVTDEKLHLSPLSWDNQTRKPFFRLNKGQELEEMKVSEPLGPGFITYEAKVKWLEYIIWSWNKFLRRFYYSGSDEQSQVVREKITQKFISLANKEGMEILFIYKDDEFSTLLKSLESEEKGVNIEEIFRGKKYYVDPVIQHINEAGNSLIAQYVEQRLLKRLSLKECKK